MRISRMYVDHFGAPTGWYEQTTFDLCNVETNEPGDACFNLENGGGKTSLLSYIFSCFEPDKKNWLQFVRSKTHMFRDYFANDGRPSFIVIEAIMPARTPGGQDYPLIIGQAVVLKDHADRASDADRRFFTFEANAGLRWEDLPFPGISIAPVKTMAEFMGWVHKSARQSSGDFYITSTQGEWTTHLEERRMIDLELLKMQVAFNSREGGSSDGFLSFSSEGELVSKVLDLAMSKEQTAELRKIVGQSVDNLKSKPRLAEKLHQFKQLQEVMIPFSESALQVLGATEALKDVEQQAVNVTAAMRSKLVETEAELKFSSESIGDLEQLANKHLQASNSAYSDHVAITGLLLKRDEEAAGQELIRVSSEIQQGELRHKALRGALALREIAAINASLQDLVAKKDAITRELKPLEEECSRNGSLLRFKLWQEIERLDGTINQLVEKRVAAQGFIIEIDQKFKDLNKVSAELNNEQGALMGTINAAKKIYDSLIAGKLLLPTDIDVNTAIDRFTSDIHEREGQLEELKASRAEKTTAVGELRAESSQASHRLSSAISSQAPLQKYLVEHGAALERLQSNQLLIDLVQGTCDPRSQVLIGNVQKLIELNRSEISKKDVRLDQLERERESILQTGLSGRNSDVDQVVEALTLAGVRSARAANTYVADLRKDADEARALVLSDPSRYLGVNVASDEWERARSLVAGLNLELSTPVTLAIASLAPANSDSDRIVLRPGNDSAFNREAAQVALTTFEATIAKVSQERDEFVRRDNLAQEILSEIKAFQATYSNQQVVSAEDELESFKEQAALTEELIKNLSAQIDEADHYLAAITPQIEQLQNTIRTLDDGRKKLLDYLEAWHEPGQDAQAALKVVLANISKIVAEVGALEAEKQEKSEELGVFSEQVANLKPTLILLHKEHDEVVQHDPALVPSSAATRLSLDALRTRYSDAVLLLSTSEKDRLGVLGHQLEINRNTLEKAEKNYRQDFHDVDADFVRTLVHHDIESEISHQAAKLDELAVSRQEKQSALSDAKAEIKEYWRGRERIEPSDEMLVLADDDLRIAADSRLEFHEQKKAEHETAVEQIRENKGKVTKQRQFLADLRSNLKNLEVSFERENLTPQHVDLSDDIGEMVNDIILKLRVRDKEWKKHRKAAGDAYQSVMKIVGTSEFRAAEGQIAEMFASEDLDRACADNAHISVMITDRIAALEGTLEGMVPDFDRCVTEIFNQVASATTLIKHALSITMPVGTPYVSGRSILKMSGNLHGMTTDQRRGEIAQYLNRLLETTIIPNKGAEIIAQCLILFTSRQTFGLQILKMEENTEFQYQPVNNMKGSGGQGTVIAMFLYMLVSHLRVGTAAKAMRGGGGPLLLDNPFANVQTRALIDAQRMLAKSFGIQLICLTANADPNIIEGFNRVLRLRKAGMQRTSRRTLVELATATFVDEVATA